MVVRIDRSVEYEESNRRFLQLYRLRLRYVYVIVEWTLTQYYVTWRKNAIDPTQFIIYQSLYSLYIESNAISYRISIIDFTYCTKMRNKSNSKFHLRIGEETSTRQIAAVFPNLSKVFVESIECRIIFEWVSNW